MTEPHICPPDHKHGETSTCYGKHGCRCVSCAARQSLKCRNRRQGITSDTFDSLPGQTAFDIARTERTRTQDYFAAMAVVAAIAAASRASGAQPDAAVTEQAELRARIDNPELFALADDLAEAELLRREASDIANAQTTADPDEERFAA